MREDVAEIPICFLQAILGNPADQTVRLILADWLEDRDDPRGPPLRLLGFWWRRARRNGGIVKDSLRSVVCRTCRKAAALRMVKT